MNLDSSGDVARAEHIRAEMRAAAVNGQPADIAAALSRPGVPDDFLARPFQVVTELNTLHGPATGHVAVPEALADVALSGEADVDDPYVCALLYQRVLRRGSTELQQEVLNRGRLLALWPRLADDLHPALTEVWQQRFPELAEKAAPWTPPML